MPKAKTGTLPISQNLAQTILDKHGYPDHVERKHKPHKDGRGTGRPWYSNLLNDEERGQHIQDRFCAAIELGLPLGQAAGFAGVGRSTIERWLTQGRKLRDDAQARADAIGKRDGHDPKVPEPDNSPQHATWRFLERFEEAIGICQVHCYSAFYTSIAGGDWRAAKTLLAAHERGGFTDRGSRQQREEQLKVATDYQNVDVDTLEKIVRGQTKDLTVIDVKPNE